MSPDRRRRPGKGHLEQLIGRYSRDTGIAADRVRRWVSTMALLGALDRVQTDRDLPRFLLKRGVAIELRLRMGARATKDVDIVFRGGPAELIDGLDEAFAEPHCDFGFLRGEPADHGPHARRFDVRLRTSRVPVRRCASRRPVPRQAPTRLSTSMRSAWRTSSSPARARSPACLCASRSPRRLHAVSERPVDRINDRFRDLVDLLVLRDLIDDLPALRLACETTFAGRATHAWPPPELDAPESWQVGYARLAREVGLTSLTSTTPPPRCRRSSPRSSRPHSG